MSTRECTDFRGLANSRFSSSCDFRMAFCGLVVFTAHDSSAGASCLFTPRAAILRRMSRLFFMSFFLRGWRRYCQTCRLIFTLGGGGLPCGLRAASGGIRSNPESVTSELQLAARSFAPSWSSGKKKPNKNMELSSLEMLKKMNPPFVRPAESYSFIYLCRFCQKAQRGSKNRFT